MHVIISLPLSVYLRRIWRRLWFPTLNLPLYHTLIFIEKNLSLLSVAACSPQTWLIRTLKYGQLTLCWERLLFFSCRLVM